MLNPHPEHCAVLGREYPKKIIPLIAAAQSSIDIIVYDWRWYADQVGSPVQLFNQEIIKAARRGVRIRALLNHEPVAKILKENKIDARVSTSQKMLHVKLMIIDGEIVVIGSHNYTKSAFELNWEASVINRSKNLAEIFGDYFENLFR